MEGKNFKIVKYQVSPQKPGFFIVGILINKGIEPLFYPLFFYSKNEK